MQMNNRVYIISGLIQNVLIDHITDYYDSLNRSFIFVHCISLSGEKFPH